MQSARAASRVWLRASAGPFGAIWPRVGYWGLVLYSRRVLSTVPDLLTEITLAAKAYCAQALPRTATNSFGWLSSLWPVARRADVTPQGFVASQAEPTFEL